MEIRLNPFRLALLSLVVLTALSVVGSAAASVRGELADGTLDPTFGSGGTMAPPLSEARAVAIQPNGRIVVAGATSQNRFGIARYLPDGSVDTSFGGGDGEAVVWFKVPPNGCTGGFNDVVLQPDARIVATGVACGEVGVARFLPDATPDSSFGQNGTVRTAVSKSGGRAEANAVTLQSDGRIVVAGAQPGPVSNPALIRYNVDGTLDTTFHGDGTLVSNVPGSAYATDVKVDALGRIWIAGIEQIGAGEPAPMVARYLPRGRLDPSFGNTGVVQVPGTTLGVRATLALDSAGGAVVASTFAKGYQLARVDDGGALDATFNDDGIVRGNLSPGCCDRPLDVALQNDGRIVVMTSSTSGDGTQNLLGLARYSAAGRLDPSFGVHGKVRTSFADPEAQIFAGGLDLAPNGDFVAAGESLERGRRVALMARYVSRS
ncbi:MAG: hypothetical protein ACJ76P_14405 [Actinomycetota bacterium]